MKNLFQPTSVRLFVRFALAVALTLSLFSIAQPSYAAESLPAAPVAEVDPDGVKDKVIEIVNEYATPIAIIGVMLALVSFLLLPLLPEWAASMKGYIIKVLVVLIAISIMPAIITTVGEIGKGFVLPILFRPLFGQRPTIYQRWEHWYRTKLGLKGRG
jgi:hypothetical protein